MKKPRTQNGLLNQFELVARHASKKKSGLIIIFDELGKVFENAQKNNTDIYIFRKKNGIHYSQTLVEAKHHHQNIDSNNAFSKILDSIFRPFE